MNYKSVSIVIPCRNEEEYISRLLEDILSQNYPHNKMEIFVVDGMSNDGTREIVNRYSDRHPFIHLIDNEERTTPYALNKGINNAKNELVIRMDVHASYPDDYIYQLVSNGDELNADNVGGVCVTMPAADTLKAKAIALGISHPFGVGNSYFRIGSKKIREVDTVPFGCYKKEVFEQIGLFDEQLTRNQDDEFNGRLVKNKGKIFLVPEIKILYYPRSSWKNLAKMYYQYGYFKPLVNIKLGSPATLRQFVPLIFVLSLAATFLTSFAFFPMIFLFSFVLGLYVIANSYFSLNVARRCQANNFPNSSKKKQGRLLTVIKFAPIMFITFAIVHFSYGTGYIKGILDFVLMKKHKRKMKEVSVSR